MSFDECRMQNTDAPLLDFIEGQRRKEQGIALAASGYGNEWIDRARSVAEILAAQNGEVTIEDVYQKIGIPPRPNMAGSVFRGKRFRFLGFDTAQRKERQGGTFRRWGLA